jgi:hypothetical protein
MEERKHMKHRESTDGHPPRIPPAENSAAMHDAEIRKHLGALVHEMIEKGQFDQLHQILTDHAAFIQDILGMLEKRQK